MFEAYSVAVTLRLNNLISPQLLLLAQEFQKLEGLAVTLKSALRGVGESAPGLRAVSTAINSTSASLDRASRSAEALQRHLAAARATAASMPPIIPNVGGAGPRLPGNGGGQRPGGGNAAAAAGHGGLHGGAVHMGSGGIGMGSVGFAAAGGGMLPMAIGAGAIFGGKALYESARDYETAYARFKTLNLGGEVNKQADQFARGTHVFGVASKDLMETTRESVGMFGNVSTALKLAPVIAQLNAANSALFSGKIGHLDEGQARSLMRFNDMRGLTDSPEDFMRGLNLAQRMTTGSGGMIKILDLELMAKRGGAAFKGMSDDGIMMLSSMVQENGGSGTGTAIMSLYQNLVGGRTTKKTMAALEAAHLVTLGSVNTGTVGGKKSTSTQISSIVDEKMLRENPGLWLMTYATKAAKDAGATNDSEVVSFVNKLISNRTGSNMGALFTTQSLQALRDNKLVKNAMGAQQTVETWKQTAGGKEGEFIAAWGNFKTEFGTLALPAFTNMLVNGAGFLRGVTDFMHNNAGLISALGTGAGWVGKVLPTGPITALGNVIFGGDAKGEYGNEGRGHERAGVAAYGNPNIRGRPDPSRQTLHSTIVMPDGKVLAKVVSDVQAKELSRPLTGPRTFDGSMAPQGTW
jgi:hypothetical protein